MHAPQHPERRQQSPDEGHRRTWTNDISVEELRAYLMRELEPILRMAGIPATNLRIYPAVVPADTSESMRLIECTISEKICIEPTTVYCEPISNPSDTFHRIRTKIVDALAPELPEEAQRSLLFSVPQIATALDALRHWECVDGPRGRQWYPLQSMKLIGMHAVPSLPANEQRAFLFRNGHNPRNTRSIRVPPFSARDQDAWFAKADALADYIEADFLRDAPVDAPLRVWVDPQDPWTLHLNVGSATHRGTADPPPYVDPAMNQQREAQPGQWKPEQQSYTDDDVEKGTQQSLEALLAERGLDMGRIIVLPGKNAPETKDTEKREDYLCEYPSPFGSVELQRLCNDVERSLQNIPGVKIFICIRTTLTRDSASIYIYHSRSTPAS